MTLNISANFQIKLLNMSTEFFKVEISLICTYIKDENCDILMTAMYLLNHC